jgi:CRISPR system Cascade subunit CasE
MYFSRIRIRPDATTSPEFWKVATGPYQIHSMVWDLFADSEDRRRDFIYRVDSVQKRPVIYTVSQRTPVYLGNVWSIETKEYTPRIADGQHLAFALRANPVRTRWTEPDEEGKRVQKRHDVVMDAKRAIRTDNDAKNQPCPMADLIQSEGVRWLREKGKGNGFVVDDNQVLAGAYRQYAFRQGPKNNQVSISSIDFTGLLSVTDRARFLTALMTGIGPAKGFGCGMLMVRPPA